MKMIRFFAYSIQTGLFALLLVTNTLNAQVTFTVTPSSVGADYTGLITLKITGLTNGETVNIGKHVDLNANANIDTSEPIISGFRLKDGGATVLGGVTNLNAPYDSDSTAGTVVYHLNQGSQGFEQRLIGSYVFTASSPTKRFATQSATFTITNSGDAQKLNGTVSCNGSPVPYAGVVLFVGQPGNSYPVRGIWSDASGHYSINVPTGTYSAVPFFPSYVADMKVISSHTLSTGEAATDALNLQTTTRTISGKMIDPNDANATFPAISVALSSANGLFTFAMTDVSGNFSIGVTPDTWEISFDNRNNLPLLGYLGVNQSYHVDTTSGSISGMVKNMVKSTALIYGTLKGADNTPLTGVEVTADNQDNDESVSVTDANGRYTIGVSSGTWNLDVNTDSSNYLFSQIYGLAITDNQALLKDIIALQTTRHIFGYLKDNNNQPLSGIGIWANTTINGITFNAWTDTDESGYYSLNVVNGSWNVGVSSGSGDDDALSSNYLVPSSQFMIISGNDVPINFVAYKTDYTISGSLRNANNQPIANVSVYAFANIGGQIVNTGTQTDSSGNFSFGVLAGTWDVGLSCEGDYSLNAQGYQCVEEKTVSVSTSNVTLDFTAQTCSSLSITTSTLPPGQVSVHYFNILSADGCHAPFTWELAADSPALPAGLEFSSLGYISGTPTASGQFIIKVKVTDSANNTLTTPLFLYIQPPVQITSVSRLDSEHVQFQVLGNAGSIYVIQSTTNLVNSTWNIIQITNPPTMPFWFKDTTTNGVQKYYRVRTEN